MRQKFTTKKQQGPKRGRQRIQVQGRQGQTGRIRNTARMTGKGYRTTDDNPTRDKRKTDTIYRGGGNRCTTSDSNEIRVAEGRCRELNN